MANEDRFITEVGRSLDEAVKTLRWCRQHLGEREVALRLQEMHITLGALALALDYKMDGDARKTNLALEQADWRMMPRELKGVEPWWH
jgi:hypothetical protein